MVSNVETSDLEKQKANVRSDMPLAHTSKLDDCQAPQFFGSSLIHVMLHIWQQTVLATRSIH